LILLETRPAVIFCGDDLPDGDLLVSLQTLAADTTVPVIALSHLAEWDACVDAFSAGAFDYIACPPNPNETERVLRSALGHLREYSAA
jgi:DNA-binding NtrC family response regulator